MRHARLAACVVAVAVSGCGGGDDDRAGATATTPTPISGERVLTGAGCLACHQIGERGNSGPGDNLAGLGARKSSAQIRGALKDHEPPVPAYRRLTPRNRAALITYLASLRGDCPEGSDCG
jgi:menaquinol-cytochrome c reductase cytochrome b/c subunit